MTIRFFLLVISLFYFSLFLSAGHDEGIDGDISGDALNPTVVNLAVGSNIVKASSVAGDREYFTITILPNHELSAINLTEYSGLGPAFLGFMSGATFTEPPTMTNVGNLLGWTHLGTPLEDKLPVMATPTGIIGYAIPLPAGTYTFWSQETSTNTSSYTLDFVIREIPSAIPTMSEWTLIILGLSMCIFALVVVRSNDLQEHRNVGFS